jgi:hypothetical protein
MRVVVARLIVSLSGLADAPEPLRRGAEIAAALDARGVPISQLLRPRDGNGVLQATDR